jgi:hypothetical protein
MYHNDPSCCCRYCCCRSLTGVTQAVKGSRRKRLRSSLYHVKAKRPDDTWHISTRTERLTSDPGPTSRVMSCSPLSLNEQRKHHHHSFGSAEAASDLLVELQRTVSDLEP